MVSLATRVKQLRSEKAWTQLQLAKKTKLSLGYIARLETGFYDPQLSTLRKLAKVFGVTMSELVEHKEKL